MTGQNSKTEDTVSTHPISALFPDECTICGNIGLTVTTHDTFEKAVCCDCMIDFIVNIKERLKNSVEK